MVKVHVINDAVAASRGELQPPAGSRLPHASTPPNIPNSLRVPEQQRLHVKSHNQQPRSKIIFQIFAMNRLFGAKSSAPKPTLNSAISNVGVPSVQLPHKY